MFGIGRFKKLKGCLPDIVSEKKTFHPEHKKLKYLTDSSNTMFRYYCLNVQALISTTQLESTDNKCEEPHASALHK